MNVKYKRKSRRIRDRNYRRIGIGLRVSDPSADTLRYPRVRSAKRFIILGDHVTNLVFRYKTFGYSGYGCKKVEIINREEESLLERYGGKLCWKCR